MWKANLERGSEKRMNKLLSQVVNVVTIYVVG